MASPSFIAYDRTLRRIYMLNLVEALSEQHEFRASIVVNPRTGRALRTGIDGSVAGLEVGTRAGARASGEVAGAV